MKPELVVIGNPDCRRVGFWKAAATRLGWAGVKVLTYADLLQERACDVLPDAVVRIESPGGDWETFKGLLRHGISPAESEGYPALDERAVARLEYERGWLIRPRQAHLGFLRVLRFLERHLLRSGACTLQSCGEIAVCFDKPACQARLARHGIPTPLSLGAPKSYDALRSLVGAERRVMVKLAHGSGAAGCLAIHYANGQARGITTVAQVQSGGATRLYHSKRARFLHSEWEIAALVDRLCVEGVQLEVWLPKARHQGRNFDLRVVTIDAMPRHMVMRSSTSIFTNLTLGNERGDLAAVIRRMGPDAWQSLLDTCATVAGVFPHSFTLGIDILVRPDWRRHDVLEVNAFGDLLLNQLDQGEDTYTATLNAWERRQATAVREAAAP